MTVGLPVAGKTDVRRGTWRLIRDDGRAVIAVVALNCLAAAAGLASPWLLGMIVDRVTTGAEVSTVDKLAAALVGFALTQLLLTRYARYLGHRFGERALARLREQFVGDTLALPTSVVERAGSGDLMTRSSADVATVGATLRDAAPDMFIAALQAIFIFGAVFALHPYLGLCGFLGLAVIAAVNRWYRRRARAAYLAEGEANSLVSQALAETAEGARAVEAFGLQRRRIEVGDRAIAAAVATRMRTLILRMVLFFVVDAAHAMPLAGMLIIGGIFHTADVVSLGAVVAATLYMWQLVEPLDRMFMWLEQLQRSGASLARILGVGAAAVPVASVGAVPAGDRIEVRDVRFAYRPGHDVLRGVDLDIRPGERLAVVGPSGAGKSTLGRLLAGVDPPRTGSVTIGGVPVADLAADELRRRIILVTQEHHVFGGTLRENLAIARPTASDDTMRAALSTVDATWVADLPAGLDTTLGAGGTRLDAAQEQQLALARVVLADPRTVILDEATSLLDPSTARHAERSLAAVLAGRTVIAIAHRLHAAHDADRVAVIDGGVITELGSHDELTAANGSYADLWRTWHSP